MINNSILHLENVCKHFGGVVAGKNITLDVQQGKIYGLIGPNGAGKTTLMNIISGIYIPDSGTIYFDGKDITNTPAHIRSRIGIARTFQVPRFMQRSSIKDNLLLAAEINSDRGALSIFRKEKSGFDQELNELLRIANLEFDWSDDINSLPFGKRKLLEIVRSLLTHPKVILVDEPAAGLNNKEMEYVAALLEFAAKKKNIGVMLIEHSMELVMNLCEEIIVLCFGEVISRGLPEEIAENPMVIEAYLGDEQL